MPTVNGPDEITTLEGGNNKVFYSDSSGDVTELPLGASGEVLTSAGATSPPTFSAIPASGGTTPMTSSGSITAGNIVVENTDGTVSTVTSTLTDFSLSAAVAADTTYVNSYTNFMAYDDANGCTALLYRDSNDSDNCYVVFVTESGGTVTTTTPYKILNATNSSGQGEEPCAFGYDDHNDVYLAVFRNSSNAYLVGIAFTYDGSSVTIDGSGAGTGATTNIETAWLNNTADYVSMCWDTTNNVFHVALNTYNATNQYIMLTVSVTSGRAITAGGSFITIASSSTITNAYFPIIVWDQTNEKVFAGLQPAALSEHYYYYPVAFNGSTYTVGSLTQISSTSLPYFTQAAYDHNTGQVVVAWGTGGSGDTYMNVVDMSDDSIGTLVNVSTTYGGSSKADNWNGLGTNNSWLAPRNQSLFITDSSSGWALRGGGDYGCYAIAGTVGSGKSLSFSSFNPFYSAQMGGASGFYKSQIAGWNATSNKLIVSNNPDADYDVAALTLGGGSTNVNKWLGFAESTVGTGVSVDVTHVGGINENQTGLTVGSTYYTNSDGTLTATAPTMTATNQWRRVGKAISATKLLVTGAGDTAHTWGN